MALDLRSYRRDVYSTLDFVSDVGGLYGAISPIFLGFVTIIGYYSSYQFVMTDLFLASNGTDGLR